MHGVQARRQNLAARGAKNQKGCHIFKILYWMYAATRRPNVKLGCTDFKWGSGTTSPPLATALMVCALNVLGLSHKQRTGSKTLLRLL